MHKLEFKEKEYNFPERIEELTLGLYEQIQVVVNNRVTEKFTYKDIVKIISLITGMTEEVIMSSVQFFNLLFSLTKWIYVFDYKKFPMKAFLNIGGEEFTYSQDANVKMKEWVDSDEILKSFPEEDKLSSVLAVRLRKRNEDYNSDLLEERKLMYKKIPVSDAMPIINFFLFKGNQSATLTNHCSQVVEIAHMQQVSLENLVKNGGGMRPLSNWQKKIYWKLTMSLKKELSKCSTSFHSLRTNEIMNTKF